MADETEDEVIVQVEPEEKLEKAEGEVKVTTEPDPAVAEAKAQYDKLAQERDAERARAEAAERQAEEHRRRAEAAAQEAHTARGDVVASHLGSVTSGLAAAEAEATAAEQAYAAAMEAGNFIEAAKAQRRMARAEAESIRLNEAKDNLEARRSQPQPQNQPSADPVEAYIQNRTEPTQKWLREHRDWILDPKKNAKLTAAHWNAVAEGLVPDTEAYFETVEKTIGLRQSETKGNGDASNGAVQVKAHTRRPAPVAPVASGASSAGAGSPEVRLSKREAEAATDGTHVWNYNDPTGKGRFKKGDPIGVQEMARRKLAMQKQGLYDKSLSEA